MPDVREGLTTEAGDLSFPDHDSFELDADSLAAKQEIRENTERSHAPADDPTFTKEAITSELLAPSGIAAGLESADSVDRHGNTAADRERIREERARLDDQIAEQIADVSSLSPREATELAARRRAAEIQPHVDTLYESYDPDERVRAWAALTGPGERQNVVALGLVHEAEVPELDAGAQEAWDTLQRVSHELSEANRALAAGQQRQERYEGLINEFGWSPAQAIEAVHLATRYAVDAGLPPLSEMSPRQWETAVRASIGVTRAESKAFDDAQFKREIFDAETTDIASGLTENGRPVIERPTIAAKPDYRLVETLASGRTSERETASDIQQGVLAEYPTTAAIRAAAEGSSTPDQVPEETRRKAAALGIAL